MSNLLDNIYIIEDGFNTNYISCLLLTIFLEKNIIYNNLLLNDNISVEYFYLQELIKNLINDFKIYKIMNSSKLNYFRNMIFFKGFKDPKLILDNNSIIDLYEFILEKFNVPKIEFINISSNLNSVESFNYIDLKINNIEIDIKKLIEKTFENRLLNNIPNFIGIKLSREQNNFLCDIQKKIKFNSIYNYSNKTDTQLIWEISCIICYDFEISNYFSFIIVKNNWYMINQFNIPSIQKINIKDYELLIKLKTIFTIYKFSDK